MHLEDVHMGNVFRDLASKVSSCLQRVLAEESDLYMRPLIGLGNYGSIEAGFLARNAAPDVKRDVVTSVGPT